MKTNICFYCKATVKVQHLQKDHFPIPECCGGKKTVPCCVICHDMKDNFTLGSWSDSWHKAVIADMDKMSRETKIFLAKVMRMGAELKEVIDKVEAL